MANYANYAAVFLFILRIPYIIDNKFMTLNNQNEQTYSLGIYIKISHLSFLHISVRKGISSGI
jgi:hypothetical protein